MCYSRPVQRIGIRELRQNASRYLAAVQRGESVEVTDRGELVGIINPVRSGQKFRDLLIRTGQLVPASRPFRIPQPIALKKRKTSIMDALEQIRARPDENKVTSILSRVEVLRVCARESETATALAKILLAGIDVIEISDVVVELASDVHASRSFDAIHLVSALTIQEGLTEVVAYDRRLLDACSEYQLNTVSPGW